MCEEGFCWQVFGEVEALLTSVLVGCKRLPFPIIEGFCWQVFSEMEALVTSVLDGYNGYNFQSLRGSVGRCSARWRRW